MHAPAPHSKRSRSSSHRESGLSWLSHPRTLAQLSQDKVTLASSGFSKHLLWMQGEQYRVPALGQGRAGRQVSGACSWRDVALAGVGWGSTSLGGGAKHGVTVAEPPKLPGAPLSCPGPVCTGCSLGEVWHLEKAGRGTLQQGSLCGLSLEQGGRLPGCGVFTCGCPSSVPRGLCLVWP